MIVSWSNWLVLTCVGLVLIRVGSCLTSVDLCRIRLIGVDSCQTRVDSCQTFVDLCWLVLDSCWFVRHSCWFLLTRVDSCWLVLVLVYYTMFRSYQIAIAPFQFSYRIVILFPLEQIFFGMIFVTVGVGTLRFWMWYEAYQIAIDLLKKPNGNTSGMVVGYDFEFKWIHKTYNY